MNTIKRLLVQKLHHRADILSISAFYNTTPFLSQTDTFDLLFVIITEEVECSMDMFHYIKDSFRIQERWLTPADLEAWLLSGENRNIIHWVLQGEILVDRGTYLEGIRHRLLEFPEQLREQKLLIEFSYFLTRYIQSKEYLKEDHFLDAYSNILEALHHWARMAIIEQGIHPELTVWNQVRKLNPGVYKLYEELTLSTETIKQRVELVLLATEFSVMSKLKDCSVILQRIIESRKEAWSVNEIQRHPFLRDSHINLSLLLNFMVKKSLIREVAVPLDDTLSELELELRYTSMN